MSDPQQYPTSVCVTDIPHAELSMRIHQWSVQGYRPTRPIPSYYTIQPTADGEMHNFVVLWTVFFELVPF